MMLKRMFEDRERYVSTRNGTFLVMHRRLAGNWEVAAVAIRAILVVGASVLVTVFDSILPKPNDLYSALVAVAIIVPILLSMIPWQVVATKIVARRIEWIAGKPPTNTPHTIKLIDDDM